MYGYVGTNIFDQTLETELRFMRTGSGNHSVRVFFTEDLTTSYINFDVENDEQHFSLFNIPSMWDVLSDIIDEWEFQFMNWFV